MAAMEHAVASYIPEPTYCRIKHTINPSLSEKLDHLQNVITAFLSSQQQQDKMITEAKLLHIMIYKRNRQLRSDKSLQLVKRVQACLKRASKFGRLFSLAGDVHKDLISAAAERKECETVYLPAQQTWAYLLYLQMQYAKLLDTNSSFCIIAFKHLSCQLSSGMLIPQMVVFMAIVARVWLLSRSITEKILSCYGTIHPLRLHFNRTNSEWKDPVLPLELQLDNTKEVNADLQAELQRIGHVSATESNEIIQEKQHNTVVKKNVFSSLDEADEDIGVPVVMKRPAVADSRDSTQKKGEKRESRGIKMKKQRKIKKDGKVKLHAVKDVTDGIDFDLTAKDMPTTKRKKRLAEHIDKLKPKKIKLADNVKTVAELQSVKATKKHDTENCYSNQSKKKSKKHKKMTEITLSNRRPETNIADDDTNIAVKASKKSKNKEKKLKNKVNKIEKLETKSKRLEVKKAKAILKIKKKFAVP